MKLSITKILLNAKKKNYTNVILKFKKSRFFLWSKLSWMLIRNIKANKENFIKELNNNNFPNEIFN